MKLKTFQAFGLGTMGNSSARFRKNFESSGALIQRLIEVWGARAD